MKRRRVEFFHKKDQHFATYPCQKLMEREGGRGQEWNYGCGGVGMVGTGRVCHCRTFYWIPSVMILEAFKLELRERSGYSLNCLLC